MWRNFLIVFLCSCQFVKNLGLSCMDEQGQPVDWYFLYKFPQINHVNPNIKNGTAYAYIGPNDTIWRLSDKSVNLRTSSFGFTLNPVYMNPKTENDFLILYNDEDPNGSVTLDHGHTKGVVAFEGDFGFWLIHSVPKYPPHLDQNYSYPSSGQRYGQSALCISINISQAEALSKLLFHNDPNVYDFYLPDEIAKKYPLFVEVTKKERIRQRPWNLTITLLSQKNAQFQVFSKFRNFGKDIYSQWMAPFLGSDLLTETWQNGPQKLPSECSDKFTVENIKQISFPSFGVSFNSSDDHSKLAISKGSTWTCVGDINRMKPQERRGGGSACFNSPIIWKNFHSLITIIQECNSIN